MTSENCTITVQKTIDDTIIQKWMASIERIRQSLPVPQNSYETVITAQINEFLDAEKNACQSLALMGVQIVGRLP